MAKKLPRNPKCDGKRCWICEKAGVPVSKDMHDFIIGQIKKLARLNLGFGLLGEALIGEENLGRMFNGYTEQWAGDARYAAGQILARRGAK